MFMKLKIILKKLHHILTMEAFLHMPKILSKVQNANIVGKDLHLAFWQWTKDIFECIL